MSRGSQISWSGKVGFWEGTTRFGGAVLAAAVFDTGGSLLLRLLSSPFRGCCGLGFRFLRPGRLPGGGHFRLLRGLRVILRTGIRMWVGGWIRGGLYDTLHSDEVVPLCSAEGLSRWSFVAAG